MQEFRFDLKIFRTGYIVDVVVNVVFTQSDHLPVAIESINLTRMSVVTSQLTDLHGRKRSGRQLERAVC